jgi:hypothetical protein
MCQVRSQSALLEKIDRAGQASRPIPVEIADRI